MATREDIRAEQLKLKASGHYDGPIDGKEGSATRAAREAAARDAASAGAKRAEADARSAEAQAKAAQAQVDLVNAQAKADRERTQAENAGVDRATQIGMNVGAAAAGVAIGHRVAAGIEKRHLDFMENNAKQVSAVGKEARSILARGVPAATNNGQLLRLKGVVTTADKLHLGKIAGPKGLVAAGVLLAEGAISRFVVAPQLENETAREAVNSVATLGVFGATTILGQRSIANATPQKLPSGKDLAAIETARAVVDNPTKIPAEKMKAPIKPTPKLTSGVTSTAGRVAGAAGKVARVGLKALTPIFAGAAALATFRTSAQAGDSTGMSLAKATGAAVDMAITGGVATDIVTNPETKARIESRYQQGQIFNRANRTGNVTTQAGATPADRATSAAVGVGGVLLARGMLSEARAPGVGIVAKTLLRGGAATTALIGGGLIVSSITGGAKADELGSAAPQGESVGDAATEAVVGMSSAAFAGALQIASYGRSAPMRYGMRGLAAGMAINAAGYVVKTTSDLISSARGAPQGKAYLNSSAQKKAETGPASSPAPMRAAAGMPRGDGQTEAYTRIDKRTGKSVQVKGYATPKG